jgi:hypothetical protein
MSKYKHINDSKDGERMIDDERGVELKFDGLAPGNTVYFQYKDDELTFRVATRRRKSQELSETAVVSLGFGLRHAEPALKRAVLSAERNAMISRNMDEALRAWPASSPALSYPPPYFGKHIPIKHVEFTMAGWEGRAP